jgi:hypothetical protein
VTEQTPAEMPLDELRTIRTRLQREDDVVSYVRRVAQARLDLVRAETRRRENGDGGIDVSSELRLILSHQLTGGQPRPPRPIDEVSDNALSDELDSICTRFGFSRLEQLEVDELAALAANLHEFEQRTSRDRRERFDRLDELSAELVRRYRDGEASIETLTGEI